MPSCKTSGLWNYFEETERNKKARCSICHRTLTYNKSSGNLGRHLENKHPEVNFRPGQHTTLKMEVEIDPGGRKTSALWDYFTEIERNKKARCSICHTNLCYNNSSSSNLGRHLKKKHPEINLRRRQHSTPEKELKMNAPGGRKTSALWNYFTVIERNKKARCSFCHSTLSYTNSSGSNLWRHLKRKHPEVNLKPHQDITPNMELEFDDDPEVPMVEQPSISEDEGSPPPTYQVVVSPPPTSVVQASQLPAPPPQSVTVRPVQQLMSVQHYIQKPKPASKGSQLDNQLLKAIAKEYYPLRMVEDEEFKIFVNMLNPGYTMPTKKTLSAVMLPNLYMNTLESVKRKISENAEYVSITTDSWTSVKNQGFIAVTVHYISRENCQLNSVLLGCIQFTDQHTSENLHEFLSKLIKDWNLEGKVVAATTDNAYNLVEAIQLSWTHVGCFAHTLNLIVQKSLEAVSSTRDKVKGIVQHFKQSSSALEKLNKVQETLGIQPVLGVIQEVITRWNSTLHMFQQIQKLRTPIITTLHDVDCDIVLTSADWDIIAQCCEILQIFENMTIELSVENEVTISKITMFTEAMLHHCDTVRNNQDLTYEVAELASILYNECKDRFHEYSSHPLLNESTFLDPRFKKYGFQNDVTYQETKESIIANGNAILKEKLTCEASTSLSLPSSNTTSNASNSFSVWVEFDNEVRLINTTSNVSNSFSIWDEFDNKISSVSKEKSYATSRMIIEVDKYLLEPIIPRTENPLVWWELNKNVYPTLFTLMKRRLSIQATSVPCERMFSKTGEIINAKRSRLTSKHLDQLVFLNYNLK